MNDEPFLRGAGVDAVPADAGRNARRLFAGGSEGDSEGGGFHECENLEWLELREGTVKVGKGAFRGCRRLRRVDSPSSLYTIDDEAFYACLSLSEMNLPKGLRRIGDRAFYCCWSLSELNLPEGLQSIGRGAFLGHSFKEITVPSSVVEIGHGAFALGKVLGKVTLAGGTVMVGRNAFLGCRQLRNIVTPSRVIVVEDKEYGNGQATVVTGGKIAMHRHEREKEPNRLILASSYLASMNSADVERVKDAIDRSQIRSRFLGLLSMINRTVVDLVWGERPGDLAFGMADDWIRVRDGAARIRARFLGLLSAHRKAIASLLERAPLWESVGGAVEPGVLEIILSFLGDVVG